jgi:hypothetical protein
LSSHCPSANNCRQSDADAEFADDAWPESQKVLMVQAMAGDRMECITSSAVFFIMSSAELFPK